MSGFLLAEEWLDEVQLESIEEGSRSWVQDYWISAYIQHIGQKLSLRTQYSLEPELNMMIKYIYRASTNLGQSSSTCCRVSRKCGCELVVLTRSEHDQGSIFGRYTLLLQRCRSSCRALKGFFKNFHPSPLSFSFLGVDHQHANNLLLSI